MVVLLQFRMLEHFTANITHSARLSSHDTLAVIKLTAGVKSSSRQHADVGTYWFAAVITNRYLLVVGFRNIP